MASERLPVTAGSGSRSSASLVEKRTPGDAGTLISVERYRFAGQISRQCCLRGHTSRAAARNAALAPRSIQAHTLNILLVFDCI
jgi:hypothetical protein